MQRLLFPALCVFLLIPGGLLANGKPAAQPAGREQTKIQAFLDTTMLQIDEGQQQFKEAFKRITGIDLEIIQPPHTQYAEKLMIQLASGDLPDIAEVYTNNLPQLIQDGVIIPLDEYIAKGKNMKSIYPDFMEAVRYKDGKIYGIQTRDGGGCIPYIRRDWLVNVGLDMPETWDEFVAVLRAFTFNDPDRNGKNDTFGYTEPLGSGGSDWDWYNRAIMLDARMDVYKNNGVWVDGFQEANMKAALQRYRNLYTEGVIDTEFFTNATSTARTKLYTGQVGIFSYWANHWATNLWLRGKDSLGEHAEIVPMPPIEGELFIRRVAPLLVITVGCKNPEAVFINFIDAQYDKGPVQELFTYGAEGYHWKRNADGSAQFLINPKDPNGNPFSKGYIPPMSIINDWKQPMPIDPLVVPALEFFNRNSVAESILAGGEAYAQYYSEIANTLKPEIFSKIVIGEYTIEEGLAIYKERVKALHMADILAELNN